MKRRDFLAAGIALPSAMILSNCNNALKQTTPAASSKKRYNSIKTGVLVV